MNSNLKKFALIGLQSGVAIAALAAAPLYAQADSAQNLATAAAPADTDAGLPSSEVVVTGSRIRGVAPVGSPLIEQTRSDLLASGATSVNQLVQNLPQIVNQGVTENGRNTSGGAGNITYSSGFNIHDIGPFATLTLLNGHRIVQSGSSGGLPDPNSVPAIALERVEVVADGASAIYGSDAIAGVVNLITRRRFNGLEARTQYGVSDDGAYHQYNFGIIGGRNWSTGNITVSYEHSGHGALNGNDRSFYAADLRSRGAHPGGRRRGARAAVQHLPPAPRRGARRAGRAALGRGDRRDLAPGHE